MCVQDIIIAREMANTSMSIKEAVQVILDIGQARYYVQSENNYDYLIWEERLPKLKRNNQVIKDRVKTI